jgi:hypothetical protein
MATSGNRAFSLDVSDVIEEAYELIGLEMRTGYDARKARRSLNIMFQDWMNRGVNLWTVNQVNLTLTSGTASYALNAYDVDLMEVAIRRSGIDYTIDRITREDYLNIPNKAQTGRPTQIYLERGTGATGGNAQTVYLWPVPDNSTDVLVSYRVQSIQDADTLTNDVDVPTRFIPCMVSGLAYYMALKNAPDRAQAMKQIYEEDFARAANEDSEWGSLYIRPDNRSYGW